MGQVPTQPAHQAGTWSAGRHSSGALGEVSGTERRPSSAGEVAHNVEHISWEVVEEWQHLDAVLSGGVGTGKFPTFHLVTLTSEFQIDVF